MQNSVKLSVIFKCYKEISIGASQTATVRHYLSLKNAF